MSDLNIYNTKLSWHVMPEENEYLKVLQEQGVSNFDPIAFHRETNLQNELENENTDNLSKKERKKNKVSLSGKKVIEQNVRRKEEMLRNSEELRIKQHLEDITDIDNLGLRIKDMRTNYGKMKLKAYLLKSFLDQDFNTGSHIVFFSLQNDQTDDQELQNIINPIIERYKQQYDHEDMVALQMKKLSSFLPPLDPLFIGRIRLDDWQLQVFNLIEEKANILVCAPTSAGKTVISTYCAVIGNRTLFVVPSDELARQVAGIFRNMPNMFVKVVTNKEYFSDSDYKVIIGTPNKLEEYLVVNGFSDFTYAIFDEWHMLNSEEGASYEKLFKLLKCPFLALSATLESPNRIRGWMEQIKEKPVHLIQYSQRFIVQQRYLYNDNNLVHLHPLSCVNLDYLQNDNFLNANLSFTPRDSFDLYEKISQNIDNSDNLHPRNILNKDQWDQITLTETMEVERTLKEYLHNLSISDPEMASNILSNYHVQESHNNFDLIKLIKILQRKNMCPAIFFKIDPVRCLEVFKYVVRKLEDNQNKKFPYHNEDLEFRQSYYDKFIKTFETNKQKAKIPQDADPEIFIEDMKKRIEKENLDELKSKFKTMMDRRIKKINDDTNMQQKIKDYYVVYYTRDLNTVLNQESLYPLDVNRPHPEFCFNNMGIDSMEMRKIRRELKTTLGEAIGWDHPFLIGIERGVIPYFKDMEVPFQRIAQSLFSQKKIPIIISDESLGYGINLPIRTVVMLGENETEVINPTIASQMSGRSGRRGIDREGNVVYVGVDWKNILRGNYERLEGRDPIDKSIALPFYFEKNTDSKVIKTDDMNRLLKITLSNYSNNNDHNDALVKRNIIEQLKNIPYSRKPEYALLIWSCRIFGNNAFYLPKIINNIDNADKYQIFEILSVMFDTDNEIMLDENNKIYKMFNQSDLPTLHSGEYLLTVFKQNKLNANGDIKRLKKIANLISMIHYNIISNNDKLLIEKESLSREIEDEFIKIQRINEKIKNKKPLINTFENIFNNLKVLIKKNLF